MKPSMSVGTILLVALISCAFVEARAQVNFSPTWGKRVPTILAQPQTRETSEHVTVPLIEECKMPFDGVVRVLRLIQNEAQRLLRCENVAGESLE